MYGASLSKRSLQAVDEDRREWSPPRLRHDEQLA